MYVEIFSTAALTGIAAVFGKECGFSKRQEQSPEQNEYVAGKACSGKQSLLTGTPYELSCHKTVCFFPLGRGHGIDKRDNDELP